MSRAEHTFQHGDVKATLTVPDGVEVPPWVTLKILGELARFDHVSVRNVRTPAKRKPQQSATATALPADWEPTLEALELMRAKCPSVNFEHELEQMRDFYIGKGQRNHDWLRTWQRWIRETHKRNVERGWKPSATPRRDEDPRAKWIREHGLTEAEYEANKHDSVWLDRITRRGKMQ